MKKKITVSTAVVLVLFAVLLTFQITYNFVGKKYQDKVDTLTKTQSDFSLLAEADLKIRENFNGLMDDEKVESGIISGYVSALLDPYSTYLTAEEYTRYQKEQSLSGNGIGVRLTFDSQTEEVIVYHVFEDSPAQKAGVQPGDVITEIGGASDLGFYEALTALSGPAGETVKLRVSREIATQTLQMNFSIVREEVSPDSISYRMLEGSVGYVQIFSFDSSTVKEFETAVNAIVSGGGVGIIFDVRNTAGGSAEVAIEMLDLLLPEGKMLYKTGANGEKEEIKSKKGHVDLPMAVLMNSSSSFASELFSVALKDFDAATLVGEKTYGKSRGQIAVELSSGSALILSNSAFTPVVSPGFEGIGIEPDIECKLKSENLYLIDPDRDNQLQEAFSAVWNYR